MCEEASSFSISELTAGDVLVVAGWFRELDENFYDVFDKNADQVSALIADLCASKQSEFYESVVFFRDREPAGVVTCYASEQLFSRRLAALRYLIKLSNGGNDVKRQLGQLESARLKVAAHHLYLSKFYVAQKYRGSELAHQMMKFVVQHAAAIHREPILHVHQGNRRAIAFYERFGFEVCQADNFPETGYMTLWMPSTRDRA